MEALVHLRWLWLLRLALNHAQMQRLLPLLPLLVLLPFGFGFARHIRLKADA